MKHSSPATSKSAKPEEQHFDSKGGERPEENTVRDKAQLQAAEDDSLSDDGSHVEAEDEMSDNYHEVDSDEGDPVIEFDPQGRPVEYISSSPPPSNDLAHNALDYFKAVSNTIRGSKIREHDPRGISEV